MTQKFNETSNINQATQSWRDVLPVHPAAKLLPRMSDAELKELGADIVLNGQHTPIVILLNDDGTEQLLDGLNRLDAMERAGIEVVKDGHFNFDRVLHQHIRGNTDPIGFVLGVNLYRRHLTVEQKGDLIAKLLGLKPKASNRDIARITGTSHPTVAKVRRRMETGGKITTSPTRIGKDGVEQPATKPPKPPKPPTSTPDLPAVPNMPATTVEPTVRPAPVDPDALARFWTLIEAIDKVHELGRLVVAGPKIDCLTQSCRKKINSGLRDLAKILRTLREEVAKPIKTADVKPAGPKSFKTSSDVDAALKNWRARSICECEDLSLAVRRAAGTGLHLSQSQWRTVQEIKDEIAARNKAAATIMAANAA